MRGGLAARCKPRHLNLPTQDVPRSPLPSSTLIRQVAPLDAVFGSVYDVVLDKASGTADLHTPETCELRLRGVHV